jgi:hypothetical protein
VATFYAVIIREVLNSMRMPFRIPAAPVVTDVCETVRVEDYACRAHDVTPTFTWETAF